MVYAQAPSLATVNSVVSGAPVGLGAGGVGPVCGTPETQED